MELDFRREKARRNARFEGMVSNIGGKMHIEAGYRTNVMHMNLHLTCRRKNSNLRLFHSAGCPCGMSCLCFM